MAVDGIRSLYIETHNFGKAAAFWMALGFEHFLDLGAASGGFRAGASGTYLFIEEVGEDQALASEPYFNLAGAADFTGVDVVSPLADTHWDTKLMEVRDPDGRVWKLEDAGQQFPQYG
ncbi:MAG TPA: hypothetical protein VM030_08490 [Acidimicrobiales bacterium]|nr:hypothetical protein [Acidimicrobiales bacterium]